MRFKYVFTFEDGTEKSFEAHLDDETISVIPPENGVKPDWAKIEYSRCKNCQLDRNEVKYCPIAVNITEIVEFFKDHVSYEEVEVQVITDDRSYFKTTTVQTGLGSLLGIFMSASGCPNMEELKPMVRFHLPFATAEETVFRSASTYLLGQYFKRKNGHGTDLDLDGLADFYTTIQAVNKGIIGRFRGVVKEDALNNAVICLEMFAKTMPYAIEDKLEDLQGLFRDTR